MKSWKKLIVILIVPLVIYIPAFIIYTRFSLDIYINKDNTLVLKNNIYVQSGSLSITDEENVGKTIGIAIRGKRKIKEYIWPVWVREFKNDKDHNRIFVKGLMDLGRVYELNQ